MWTDTAPPAHPAEARCVDLSPGDRDEIIDVLTSDNPRTHARPFETPDRWIGVRDDAGRLVAVASAERSAGGTAYLSGITVRSDQRGAGLGVALTSALTREAVTTEGVCTLGVFADNDVAIGLYRKLGYRTGARWVTRWV